MEDGDTHYYETSGPGGGAGAELNSAKSDHID